MRLCFKNKKAKQKVQSSIVCMWFSGLSSVSLQAAEYYGHGSFESKPKIGLLTSEKTEKSKIKVLEDLVPEEGPFPGHR